MTDLVTDEMVEAAARELFEWDVEEHPDPRPTWERLTEGQRDVWRSGARATLTAAALLIAAKAWEEGYTEGSRGRMWDSINPHQTSAQPIHLLEGCPEDASRPAS